MKVLILSQYFWPESFRISEVAQCLRAEGCEVTVLTGQPNYPEGQVFSGYRAWGAFREEYASGPVLRVPLFPRGRAGALRLALNYLSFVVSATLVGPWMLRGRRFDAILVYAPSPILQAIPGIWLAWLKGAALVTWVQDLWPESLLATGFVRHAKVLAAVAAVVRWIYRHNDLLLVQSPAFVEPVRRMAGQTPVAYHPNPGELAYSTPAPATAPVLSIDPGFNVVFAGNMGTVQALETVVEAARLLRHLPHIRFVLVGSGSRSEWLQSEIERLGLTNLQLPGRFPLEAMPGILAQASVLLVSLARSPIMSQTIPSKVQAYLAAGKPIIASLDGEGARVVMEAEAGLACPAEDPEALAAAVIELQAADAATLGRLGENSRRYYEAHFQPDHLAVQLINRLERLLDDQAHQPGRDRARRGHGADDAR